MFKSMFLFGFLLISSLCFSYSIQAQRLKSELLYTIEIDVDTALNIGAAPAGNRIFFKALGGKFKGPKLNGKVLPTGGTMR